MVHPTQRGKRGRQRLRIIAGEWRGRRVDFDAVPGLRPTPDRVRETLFNWLQPIIEGARCLDLFAGSGALGLEAASRGASQVVLIDKHPRVIKHLHKIVQELQAHNTEVVEADVLQYLRSTAQPFDVIFLDPPYQDNLLVPALRLLTEGGWLQQARYLYLEYQRREPPPQLPAGWQLYRETDAGQVAAWLAVPEAS
jgi:16S rRNA (guanine966-N2)-methyltransferase